MSDGIVARRVVASGRVQGVWFRESLRQEASAHGVAGWVRNLDDGRVEAWLEGPSAEVERVVAWCRVGPSRAVVTACSVEERAPESRRSFDVIG